LEGRRASLNAGESAKQAKRAIRERIWELLEMRGVAGFPKPVRGRIPSFAGQEAAAERLFCTPEWKRAKVVKVNPDAPQRPVRRRALEEGKVLVVPSPRLRSGFFILRPELVPERLYGEASTIAGFTRLGKRASLRELADLGNVDLIVEGSVAVNRFGERLGKGEGYGELEYAILRELGLVGEETPIATTVHDLQVLEERIPQDPWDVPVDIVATPTRLIRCERGKRPKGVFWEVLSEEHLASIPVLKELMRLKVGSSKLS